MLAAPYEMLERTLEQTTRLFANAKVDRVLVLTLSSLFLMLSFASYSMTLMRRLTPPYHGSRRLLTLGIRPLREFGCQDNQQNTTSKNKERTNFTELRESDFL